MNYGIRNLVSILATCVFSLFWLLPGGLKDEWNIEVDSGVYIWSRFSVGVHRVLVLFESHFRYDAYRLLSKKMTEAAHTVMVILWFDSSFRF